MANTAIQIKRSESTSNPASLQYGELAYSFNSGKLFIGTSSGAAISIGGNTYNQMLDSATSSNVVDTIVKRDSSGNFSAGTITGSLSGNASTASAWQTARILGLDGDVSGQALIDGSQNANTTVTLNTVNGDVGSYGGSTNIPVFTVNEKGLITSAANVALSTSFTIAGDSGIDVFNNGSTLTFEGGDGVTSTVTDDKVSFAVDGTVLRNSGNQIISGDLVLSGDLYVGGNTTSIDVSTISVEDSLIRLANNNSSSDSIDIGFYGAANPGTLGYYGIARTISDSGNFFVFSGLPTDPTGNTISSSSVTYANTGTLRASLTGGDVYDLNTAIAINDGGTNSRATPTAGAIAYGNGTSYLFNTAGTSGQALKSGGTGTPVFGTLDLAGGGLGFTSPSSNSVVFYGSSGNSMSYTNTASDGNVLQYSTSAGIQFGMLDGGTF